MMCLNRLATSPAIVLTSKYGWSANMERIMKAQALSDGQQQSYMKGMKTLEVNPHHPLIQQLKAQACPLPHLPPPRAPAREAVEKCLKFNIHLRPFVDRPCINGHVVAVYF